MCTITKALFKTINTDVLNLYWNADVNLTLTTSLLYIRIYPGFLYFLLLPFNLNLKAAQSYKNKICAVSKFMKHIILTMWGTITPFTRFEFLIAANLLKIKANLALYHSSNYSVLILSIEVLTKHSAILYCCDNLKSG